MDEQSEREQSIARVRSGTCSARDILVAACSIYGRSAQVDMAIEECAELTIAIQHEKRCRVGPSSVVEEIADVMIMMEQLSMIYDEEDVAHWKDIKLGCLRHKVLDRICGEDE